MAGQSKERKEKIHPTPGSDGEENNPSDQSEDENEIIDDDDRAMESDGSEGPIEIPPDPAHEARMAALRSENAELTRIVEEQDRVLLQMRARTEEIQAATCIRQAELQALRSARLAWEKEEQEAKDKEDAAKGGCKPKCGDDDENDKPGSSSVPVTE